MNWVTFPHRMSHPLGLVPLPYGQHDEGTGPMRKRRPWGRPAGGFQEVARGAPRSRRVSRVPVRLWRQARADRWSALFSEIALYSFVVLAVTGVYLAVFYDPARGRAVYHGSYRSVGGVP